MNTPTETEIYKRGIYAIHELALYFKSGNKVPVERATIRADDFWRVVSRPFPTRRAKIALLWMRYGWKRFFVREWWSLMLARN